MTTMPPPLWDVSQTATYLNVSTSWVYQQSAAGKIPCVKIGNNVRFIPAQIEAYVRGEWVPERKVALRRLT
jgi:excisionase family DNA binding protein